MSIRGYVGSVEFYLDIYCAVIIGVWVYQMVN